MFTIIQYASLIMFHKSYSTKHYSFLRRYRDISERDYGQIYLGNKRKVKNGIKTFIKDLSDFKFRAHIQKFVQLNLNV